MHIWDSTLSFLALMELVRGLDNDVLLVFVISAGLCACLIKFAMKIMFRSSG